MDPRRGFSLLEMMMVLVLLALATGAILPYLEPIPGEALASRVRTELGDLRKEVQGRALEVPEHHFADLGAALRGRDVPLDPWGEPYRLVHAAPTMLQTGAPEVWDRLCRGIGLTEHTLASGGPDRTIGLAAAEDDLHVVVKLGRPPRP